MYYYFVIRQTTDPKPKHEIPENIRRAICKVKVKGIDSRGGKDRYVYEYTIAEQ